MIKDKNAKPQNTVGITVVDAPDVFLAPDEKAGSCCFIFTMRWVGMAMMCLTLAKCARQKRYTICFMTEW